MRSLLLILAAACACASQDAVRYADERSATTQAGDWKPPQGAIQQVGLSVRTTGQGPVTVVLLHGLAGSQRYYGAAFDALGEGARLIVPDLLGFGRSPRPSDLTYDADDHAVAVIRALEQLDVKSPIYLGAHSSGTLVAVRIAELRPDWVRGIVAFGPPLYADEREARRHIGELGFVVRWFAQDNMIARWTCRVMCRMRGVASSLAIWLRPDLPGPVARDGVLHSWISYVGTLSNLVYAPQPFDVAALGVPVHLVVGADDPIADLEYLMGLAERHEHVSMEIWEGGHDLPISAAQRSVQLLRERFWASGSGGMARPKIADADAESERAAGEDSEARDSTRRVAGRASDP